MKEAIFLIGIVKTDGKERGEDVQAAGSAVQRVVVCSFQEAKPAPMKAEI